MYAESGSSSAGMVFNTEASINLADDPPLMQMMVDAGFDTVFIGIETPNEDSLVKCGKHLNKNRDLVDHVKRIQRAGLQVQGGFIVWQVTHHVSRLTNSPHLSHSLNLANMIGLVPLTGVFLRRCSVYRLWG